MKSPCRSLTAAANFYGVDTFTYTARDASNAACTAALAITVNSVKDPSSITLDISPNPAGAGVNVTINATVEGDTGETPTGDLTLTDGETLLATIPLANGRATHTTSSLGIGSHNIDASYAGDANFEPSTASQALQIQHGPPTAVNDASGTLQDTPVTVAVLANDNDRAGGGLTLTGVGAPANGSALMAADMASVLYTPAPGFAGLDSFTYETRDANNNAPGHPLHAPSPPEGHCFRWSCNETFVDALRQMIELLPKGLIFRQVSRKL